MQPGPGEERTLDFPVDVAHYWVVREGASRWAPAVVRETEHPSNHPESIMKLLKTLGAALSAAAIFSLAACSSNKDTPPSYQAPSTPPGSYVPMK